MLHRGTVIPDGLELVRYEGYAYSIFPSSPCTVRTFNKNAKGLALQLEELSSDEFWDSYGNPKSPLHEVFPYYPTAEHP